MSTLLAPETAITGAPPYLPENPFTGKKRLLIVRRPLEPVYCGPDAEPWLPVSVQKAHKLVDQLQCFREQNPHFDLPEIIEVDSDPDTLVVASTLSEYGLSDDDALGAAGGDGILHTVNEAARWIDFKGTMGALAAGNCCDVAHMLTHTPCLREPGWGMVYSRLGQLHPIQMIIEAPGQAPRVEEAEYCISAGKLLEDVAATVASQPIRRATENMGALSKAAVESQITRSKIKAHQKDQFTITDRLGKRAVSDILIVNGSRMAKFSRFSGMHLLEPMFGVIELEQSTLPSVMATLALARLGSFPRFEGDTTYSFDVKSHDDAPIPLQKDGEVGQELWVPSGATIRVQVSPNYTRQAYTRHNP